MTLWNDGAAYSPSAKVVLEFAVGHWVAVEEDMDTVSQEIERVGSRGWMAFTRVGGTPIHIRAEHVRCFYPVIEWPAPA